MTDRPDRPSESSRKPPADNAPEAGRRWPLRLLMALGLAIAAHLAFSSLGFNPTDDGFILAQSRRILCGEIPHLDFISIRPVGSAVLHTLDLVLGGRHLFIVSRLIFWIEVSLISWAWLELLNSRLRLNLGTFTALPLLVLAFMFTTHAFPAMAWHTVDGILLASLGFLLSQGSNQRVELFGYALIGTAALCKQSFMPLLPLSVMLNGDRRHASAWVAIAFPAALYALWLLPSGALQDALAQLGALTDVWESGLAPYVRTPWALLGVAVGIFGASCLLLSRLIRNALAQFCLVSLGGLAVLGVISHAGRMFNADGYLFLDREAFILFGATAGLGLVAAAYKPSRSFARVAGLGLALAWCATVSLGYRTPALASGPLVLLAMTGLAYLLIQTRQELFASRGLPVGAWIIVAATAAHWWSARTDHIYHEQTAPALTYRLDGVLPGGDGIRTNKNTHAVLAELAGIVRRLDGKRYAILIDAPGWWAGAGQRNPLPIDWAQSIELCTPELQARFSKSLSRQRGSLTVIVQRVNLAYVQDGFTPLDDSNLYYYAGTLASKLYRKTEDTEYWSIYE